MEGGRLGGAISKWKGPGRCDKQMEGGEPGQCNKQMEGAWAVRYANGRGEPGRCYKQMEGAWAVR